jgi:hypothetical protein
MSRTRTPVFSAPPPPPTPLHLFRKRTKKLTAPAVGLGGELWTPLLIMRENPPPCFFCPPPPPTHTYRLVQETYQIINCIGRGAGRRRVNSPIDFTKTSKNYEIADFFRRYLWISLAMYELQLKRTKHKSKIIIFL